jgi:hypothetical protein
MTCYYSLWPRERATRIELAFPAWDSVQPERGYLQGGQLSSQFL